MKKLPSASQIKLFNTIEVETKNVCTRTCWFCKWGQLREPEPRIEMPWDILNKIIDNLARLNFTGRVSYYGTNEPLSDKRIFDIVKASKNKIPKGIHVLTTNGDLLTQDVYDRLVECGLDRLAVSCYDKKTYQKVKQIKGSKIYRLNMMDPRFETKILNNRAGCLPEMKDHAPTQKQVKQLKHYREDCQRPFTGMWVRPNGDLGLCCEDTYGDVYNGNVMDASLEDLWFNHPNYQHYRNTLTNHGRSTLKLCQNCTHKGGPANVNWPSAHTLSFPDDHNTAN